MSDDLATDASKDSRITDLFTKGSHHRNFSVITLNQNLYFSKDPTQRQNCHYLILFNNPVERQQVMTLARQINPKNLSELLKVSKGAKIRNRYNQVPHLTQDTNGKVTNSQKTPQTRAKRSALSQQVTTKHI